MKTYMAKFSGDRYLVLTIGSCKGFTRQCLNRKKLNYNTLGAHKITAISEGSYSHRLCILAIYALMHICTPNVSASVEGMLEDTSQTQYEVLFHS